MPENNQYGDELKHDKNAAGGIEDSKRGDDNNVTACIWLAVYSAGVLAVSIQCVAMAFSAYAVHNR